jgi:sensor histidine kinase regulating citrate/malate metabolism
LIKKWSFIQTRNFKIIIHNLLENSIKYHKTKEEKNPFISLFISSCNEKLQINVIDNGIGIRKNELQLFEMFSKAFSKYQSAGLGLYMVKLCVEKLGGTVDLIENPSNFTEFLIEIPIQLHEQAPSKNMVVM